MSEELGERLGDHLCSKDGAAVCCSSVDFHEQCTRNSTRTRSLSDCKYLETTRFVHAVKVRRVTPCAPMLETTGLTSDDTNEGAGRDGVWSIIQWS